MTDYDSFAKAYSAENESNLFNAYYERPEMLRLVGDVSGRRILDAGCGSGPLTAALRDSGALVTGFDASAAMVDLARQRLGGDADLHEADLGAPLPFADAEFDDVDYLMDGQTVWLTFWHRPLHAMTNAFAAAGFRIAVLSEPPPAANTPPELLPPTLGEGQSFLCFLFFVLEAV